MKVTNEKLFHYTKADTAVNYILKNKTLRFSSYKNVNDPRESKDWPFKVFCFYNQNNEFFSTDLFQELNDYIMNHIFISCFSLHITASDFSDIAHDLRMWAQYGENHKGVCIVFNKERLNSDIKQNTEEYRLFCGNIKYSTQLVEHNPYPIRITPFDLHFEKFYFKQILPWVHPFFKPECNDPYMINIERLKFVGINNYLKQHIDYFYQSLLFTKKDCWRDEREYRFTIHSDTKKEFVDIPLTDPIEAVILGDDFPIELLGSIIKLAKEQSFELYRLYSRGWENHLIPIDIDNPDQNLISINSSYPINFYYDDLFSQVCDIQGKRRIIRMESSSGNVTLID